MLRLLFPRVYEGWLVVYAVAVILTVVGAVFFYGFGLLFTPIREEFRWSNASIALAFSLRAETGSLAAPVVGMATDRFGTRRVVSLGVGTMALGVVLMSYIATLWQFYLVMFVVSIGTSAAGAQVGPAATATWFERRRALAMSLVTVGGGLSGILVGAIAWLVEMAGWREALRWIGFGIVLIGVPMAINVNSRPANHPRPIDGVADVNNKGGEMSGSIAWGIPPGHAIRTRSFSLLAIGTAAMSFTTTAFLVHQVPFFEAEGADPAVAASTVSLFALSSILGRLGFGYLADRRNKRLVLACTALLTAIGLALIVIADSFWLRCVLVVVVAQGFGGAVPVRPALLADDFGIRYFGAIHGILFLVTGVGAFFGPVTVGWIVDTTGDYRMGWLVAATMSVLAIPAILASGRPTALLDRYGPPTNTLIPSHQAQVLLPQQSEP